MGVLIDEDKRKDYDALLDKIALQQKEKRKNARIQKIKPKRKLEHKIEHINIEEPKIDIETIEEPKIVGVTVVRPFVTPKWKASNEKEPNKDKISITLNHNSILSYSAYLIVGLIIVLLLSLYSPSSKNRVNENKIEASNIPENNLNTLSEKTVSDSFQIDSESEHEIETKINSWIYANEYKDASVLEDIYADTLKHFYPLRKNLSKNYCIQDQAKDYKKKPYIHVELNSEIDYKKLDKVTYECRFIKRVSSPNKEITDFESVLVFQKFSNGFRVIEEYDDQEY